MSDAVFFFISFVVMFLIGGWFAYHGLGLIRNTSGRRDSLLKENAGRRGWHRSPYRDHENFSSGMSGGFSFEYVPKTARGWNVLAWVHLVGGLFWAIVALVVIVAALLGQIDYG